MLARTRLQRDVLTPDRRLAGEMVSASVGHITGMYVVVRLYELYCARLSTARPTSVRECTGARELLELLLEKDCCKAVPVRSRERGKGLNFDDQHQAL